jgi:hypothetical protein
MVAKVYADRLSPDLDLEGAPVDNDVETEAQAVASWFEALPPEWQRYYDDEAQSGRQAYGPS